MWGPQDHVEQKPDVFNSIVEKQSLGFMEPCPCYRQNKIKMRPTALIFFFKAKPTLGRKSSCNFREIQELFSLFPGPQRDQT